MAFSVSARSGRSAVAMAALWLGGAVVYGLVAWLNMAVDSPIDSMDGVWTAVWFPAGLALAGVLVFGMPFLPAIIVGGFTADVAIGLPPASALILGLTNALEAALAAWLLRRAGCFPFPFRRPVAVFRLLAVAAVTAFALSATVGVFVLGIAGTVDLSEGLKAWSRWGLGNVAGVMLVVPALLAWWQEGARRPEGRAMLEGVVVWAAAIAVTAVAFGVVTVGAPGSALPLAFVPMPLVALAAFRLGPRGTMPLMIVIMFLVNGLTSRGLGPFAEESADVTAMLLQTFAAVLALMALLIGAAVRDGELLRQSLRRTLDDLDDRVRARTAALSRANTQLEQSTRDQARTAGLNRGRGEVLELIATGASLDAVLRRLVAVTEDAQPGFLVLLCFDETSLTARELGYRLVASGAGRRALEAILAESGADAGRPERACDPGFIERAAAAGYRLVATRSVGGASPESRGRLLMLAGPHATGVEPDEDALAGSAQLAEVAIERRRDERQLYELANFDVLTGLLNRSAFLNGLNRVLRQAQRSGSRCALLFIDLDGFKAVNDTAGHAHGDEILVAVGHRLSAHTRGADLVARLGGDEFTVLVADIEDSAAARAAAGKLVEVLAEPYTLDSGTWRLGASIGVSVFPEDATTADALMRHADMAMYRAKEAGRGRVTLFAAIIGEGGDWRASQLDDLRGALARDELRLAYGERRSLTDRRVVAIEASPRWQHPQRGELMESAFLPLAEASGIARPLVQWMLVEACRQAATWRAAGQAFGCVSVPVPGRLLRQPALCDAVFEALATSGLAAGELELRVDATALAHSAGRADANLRRLRAAGVRLALADTAGEGVTAALVSDYTPGVILLAMPAVDGRGRPQSVLAATVALAHSVGVRVAAPAGEAAGREGDLMALGCDEVRIAPADAATDDFASGEAGCGAGEGLPPD